MFDEKRRLTSITYLSCLGGTLLLVFVPGIPGTARLIVLLVLTLTQFTASVWYSLSYIPYGRTTAKKLVRRLLGLEEPASSSNAVYTNLSLSLRNLGGNGIS